jgi:putative MFS transporter
VGSIDSASIDYDEAPLQRFHLKVAVASTGGVFADGFGIGIIGISLALATPELDLNALWIGLIGAGSLAGLFAGALLAGPVADRHGRRTIFAYNMLIAAALSVLQYWVASALQLLLLRGAIGCVLGTDYVVGKTLLTEYVPRRLRGRIVGALSVAWAGGYAVAYGCGVALSGFGPHAWRTMLLVSALPCLCIVPFRVMIPESPLWLTNHGFLERAARVVKRTMGDAVRPPIPAVRAVQHPTRWKELFSPRLRHRTLVGCIFFACQVLPYFAVGTFVAQVLQALHLQGSFAGGLIYNLALFLGAIAGLLIVDRISRRLFLIGSFASAGVAMLVLSLSSSMPAALTVLLFAIFAGILSAASNLVYVYLPELFPTRLRASGIGLAIATSRVASATGTFLLPLVMSWYGVRTALAACVVVLAFGALFCYRWAPETKDVGLESIDQESSAGAG